jgi:hypothetical protein
MDCTVTDSTQKLHGDVTAGFYAPQALKPTTPRGRTMTHRVDAAEQAIDFNDENANTTASPATGALTPIGVRRRSRCSSAAICSSRSDIKRAPRPSAAGAPKILDGAQR